MSAAKRLLFEQMDQVARDNLIYLVDGVLIAAGLDADLDEAGQRRLAERIVDGGGTPAQRRAVIRALLDRCDPDAYDAALDLESIR